MRWVEPMTSKTTLIALTAAALFVLSVGCATANDPATARPAHLGVRMIQATATIISIMQGAILPLLTLGSARPTLMSNAVAKPALVTNIWVTPSVVIMDISLRPAVHPIPVEAAIRIGVTIPHIPTPI